LNLHALVGPAIAAINPPVLATVRASAGYVVTADGTQAPIYVDYPNVRVQVQSLQYADLAKMEGLTIQGNRTAIYLPGDWNGIVRAGGKGGDLVVIGGVTWLVAIVLESWPDWTKVAVTQQVTP